jgi:TPR repeat protein
VRAEQGDMQAQYHIGTNYWFGKDVAIDHAEAARWFRKAADQGHAISQYFLGVMYESGRGVPLDQVESVRWFRKAADQGEAGAQFKLGVKYSMGSGVPQDKKEAVRWLRLAADQDDTDAQLFLAWVYPDSQPTAADLAIQRLSRIREAAERGTASAQASLGELYRDGSGVPQDYVLAHLWFNLAASQSTGEDHERYSAARDDVASKMTPGQFAEAQRLAREWKPATR